MGKYQAYPEYKNSEIGWLGDIPSHWDCIKLKYVVELGRNKVEPNSTYKYVGMENIESWTGKYIQKEDVKPEGLSTSFSVGNLLFGKLRPYLAKSWLADFCGICSSEFLVLKCSKVSPKFLNYYSLSEEFIKQVDSSTYGSKMPRASWDFISLMDVPLPQRTDSEEIANFLDHETAKIDTLIEKQQQLIKLLKEKRQAIISHAVTKGLNPNAPMRDSGVEWLGEIPEGWEIYPSKQLFPQSVKRAALSDQQLSATQDYGVISQMKFMQLAGRRVVQLNSNQELRKRVDVDDFVISMRSFQGGLERAWDAGGIRSSYVVLKPTSNIEKDFYQYLFKSARYIQALQSTTNFIRDGQDMSYQNFILIDLPLPPLEEQREISSFLGAEITRIDLLVDKAKMLVSLIQERRTALISAAVTGKIDVREWEKV